MADEFLDGLRKASGLPTEGEKLAATDEAQKALAAWNAEAPKRQALVEEFTSRVDRIVDQQATRSKTVAQELRLGLDVSHARLRQGQNMQALVQTQVILTAPVQRIAGSKAPILPKPVAILSLMLTDTGSVQIEVTTSGRDPNPDRRTLEISKVDEDVISAEITKLYAKARR